MSQQQYYDYPLPPPPPSPRASGSTSPLTASLPHTPALAGGRRSRPVSTHLPSISTAVVSEQGASPSHASTPVSGTHLSPHFLYAPRTPSALNPQTPGGRSPQNPGGLAPPPPGASPRSPVMEPYNPRQWQNNRGQVSGSQMVFQQRHAAIGTSQMTGMEAAMPSPPPPYSPSVETAHGASPIMDNAAFTASPLAERLSSPVVPSSPMFPPPPGQSSRARDRSASGLGQRFLSGLRGKQPAGPEVYQPQLSTSVHAPVWDDARPPAARRAASTGHLQSGGPSSATSSIGRASPESSWQSGRPLPGPPPGAPPLGARSQSLNRQVGGSASSSETSLVQETNRYRRAAAAPGLGPVPPTPADWVEGESRNEGPPPSIPSVHQQPPSDQSEAQPLRVNTGASRESSLTRRPARRETSAQGIRERRSQSRAKKGGPDDPSGPANLVFQPVVEGSISRRREHMRTASGYAEPRSASSVNARSQPATNPSNSVLTPPYTPAVGKPAVSSANEQNMTVPGSAGSDRPISHLLHAPNSEDSSMQAPLSPARPPPSGSGKAPQTLDNFALQALERHRAFVEKEIAASSDEERLELFASFMVQESRLRRDRYSIAYNAMAGEIMDLTRDMWRSYSIKTRKSTTPSTSMSSTDPTLLPWASDGQPGSAHGNVPSSASSLGDFTPATDTGSMDFNDIPDRPETRQWQDSFKPSLSPIPSMAVSTVPDEDDSRGRPPSRWWEASQSGGQSVGKPDRMEKTRRETKYMGVSPAELQAIRSSTAELPVPSPGASAPTYSADEYPPEKVGWHDGHDLDTPMQTPHRYNKRKASTPGFEPLDVSRLVTLPPPYPRHHPAVNNSHPTLNNLRSEHRLLADQSDVQKIKDAYLDQDFALNREQQEAAKKRRSKLRSDIQNKIADGSMSFADAAKTEASFDIEESERGKNTARSNFDVFEAAVSHPLNTLLTGKLDKAKDCIHRLRVDLEGGHGSSNPNRAQEEGDEHPERLEKLTLLKWLFEAREQLHKEVFDLHAMRSDKYSEVILTPYRISKAQAKIDEATAFFKKDSKERQLTFARDSLKRFEELQSVMEKNVSQGVEDQLSAFWDIAPGLLEVIQHIPPEVADFEVQIPLQEYDENPSYHEHPLQYLYSLLEHAEKSAYQFIESQTNLLCLLHEVRTAATVSSLKLLEIERISARSSSDEDSDIHAEMAQAGKEAEEHLTLDLKEKVGEVERQWEEALGYGLTRVKEKVSAYLEGTDGMDDGMDQ